MINAMMKDGNGVLNIDGTLNTILADFSAITSAMYEELKEQSESAADLFKKFCIELLPILAFGTDEEIEKKGKELEDTVKKNKKLEDDLWDQIKKILEELQ